MLRLHKQKWLALLVVWVVLLSTLYATLSIVRHDRFQSGGFDLGLYDQTVWQYSKFLWPYNTVKDRFILGDHFTLTLPALAPLFWIWDDVRVLLIFQAAAIATSSIAVYLIARIRKFSGPASLILAIVYSLFYGIQYGAFFDFHPVVYGVALIAWFLYFYEAKKRRPATITFVLVLLTQENMGIILAAVACVYLLRKESRKAAFLWIAVGIGVSMVESKIIAGFSPTGFQYWPDGSFDPFRIVRSFFDTSEKQQVWLYTLSSFGGLALFSPGAILGIILDLGQYFATGDAFSRMWSPFMHHRVELSVLVMLGALDALERFRRRRMPVSSMAVGVLAVTLALQFVFHLPLNKLVKRSYWATESWMEDNRRLFGAIPDSAGVATQQSLVPHMSHRREIYLVWPRKHDFDEAWCGQKSCWWLDFAGKPEYLAVDVHPYSWLTQLLETNENFEAALTTMEKAGKIIPVGREHDARLYAVIK